MQWQPRVHKPDRVAHAREESPTVLGRTFKLLWARASRNFSPRVFAAEHSISTPVASEAAKADVLLAAAQAAAAAAGTGSAAWQQSRSQGGAAT